MVSNLTRVPEKGHTAPVYSMNASFSNVVFLCERMAGFSILAAITETSASLAGTLKLQASNNSYADNVNMDPNPDAVWVDIPNSSVTLTSGSTSVMWNTADVYYESIRIVWTRSSGQGTIAPYFLAKG